MSDAKKTITATLHHYRFESASDPAYKAMVARIKANADGCGHRMHSWGGGSHDSGKDNTTETVQIETAYVFGNQWNTAAPHNRRVFDWYQEYTREEFVRGHWLEITPELAEVRRATLKCDFCGCEYGPHHTPAPATPFCTACLDSEYLKAEDLHLTRLCPVIEVNGHGPKREPLTDAERAELLPEYVRRQTTGDNSRANLKRQKQRADVLAQFEKVTAAATEERDGMMWLLDHGVSLDNVIYYSHTERFSFGWRSPVSPEVESALLKIISEFPHAYDIKTADGRTLSAH